MPLYSCQCSSGHKFDRWISIANFHDLIECDCGMVAHRLITAPSLIFSGIDYSYDCPITEKHITSKRQHEENLKRHNCRVYETGEREFNARARSAADASLEASIDATVERAIAKMPSDKLETLAKELSSGINLQVERR